MSILHYNHKDALKEHIEVNIKNGNTIDIDSIRIRSVQQIQDEQLRKSEKEYLTRNKKEVSLLGYPNYEPGKRKGYSWNSKKGYGYWETSVKSSYSSAYAILILVIILLYVIV